jgi:hypothetical protein
MEYYAHFGHTDFILCLPSQASKHWFGEDLFLALLRLRGVECAAPAKYAEGFHCRKAVLSC